MRPQFSIIIATKNAEKCISGAIQSITGQVGVSYELIVIDGCSTDSTVERVKSLVPGARLICEPDRGIYDALNKGVRIARGEWLYVLGADDRMENPSVLHRVSLASNANINLLYGNVVVDRGGVKRLVRMLPPSAYAKQGIDCPPIFHQAVFLRSDALSARSLKFDIQYRIHADYMLICECYTLDGAKHIDESICIYNAGGFSRGTLRTFVQSAREQISINRRHGGRMRWLIKALAKNFVRACINDLAGGTAVIWKRHQL